LGGEVALAERACGCGSVGLEQTTEGENNEKLSGLNGMTKKHTTRETIAIRKKTF